jgi:hypothetical protein
MQALRVVSGVLAATVATPAALALIFAGAWYVGVGGFADHTWPAVQRQIELYAILSAPVALFVTLAFGAPYTHRLQELGRATALRVTVTGAILGALPFVLFDGYVIVTNMLLLVRQAYTRDTLETAARWAGLGAWCGSWSALTYWLVAVRRPT